MLKVLALSEEESRSVSSVDLCKLYERLAISFEEKFARLSSKINNIKDLLSVQDLFNKCE